MALEVAQQKKASLVTQPVWVMGSQKAAIRELPKGAMLMIFSCLTIPEVVPLRRVSREWKILLDNRSLWNYFRWRDFGCQEEAKMPKDDYRRRCDSIVEPAQALPEVLGFQALSDELKLQVFARLHPRETPAASGVCKNWNQLLNDEQLWKYFLGLHFGFKSSTNATKAKELFQECHITSNIAKGEYTIQVVDTDLSLRFGHFSNECEKLFSITPNGTRAVLNVNSGRLHISPHWPLIKTDEHLAIYAAALIDNRILVLGNFQGRLDVFDLREETLKTFLNTFDTESRPVHSILVSKNEMQIVSVFLKGVVKVWNLTTGECERTIPDRRSPQITASILSEDSGKVILGTMNGSVEVLNLQTGESEQVFALPEKEAYPSCFAFAENGDLIIGDSNGHIHFYDPADCSCKRTLSKHSDGRPTLADVKFLKPFHNGKLLAVFNNGAAILWDLGQFPTVEKNLDCRFHKCVNAFFTPKGKLIVEGYRSYVIIDFNTADNKNMKKIAAMFAEGNRLDQAEAMEQFNLLPEAKRRGIYRELHKMILPIHKKRKRDDDLDCGESAFHDRNGESSTPQQKARAIRNCLGRLEMTERAVPAQSQLLLEARRGGT